MILVSWQCCNTVYLPVGDQYHVPTHLLTTNLVFWDSNDASTGTASQGRNVTGTELRMRLDQGDVCSDHGDQCGQCRVTWCGGVAGGRCWAGTCCVVTQRRRVG